MLRLVSQTKRERERESKTSFVSLTKRKIALNLAKITHAFRFIWSMNAKVKFVATL